MKILLDTNILVHRESHNTKRKDIGELFKWIDKLKYDKYIHPITKDELNRYKDKSLSETMNIKIDSYNFIKHPAPVSHTIELILNDSDKTENDRNDTLILNEVFSNRVDLLITEDKNLHKKAKLLEIADRVFKIQEFLEKCVYENPDLTDYSVLAIKKKNFAEVDVNDTFFDSFKNDYSEFEYWFNKNAEKECYVSYIEGKLIAFLYLKIEDENEVYSDISPVFKKSRRLKIGTFKVTANGYKIGERFLKIIFDNAINNKVNEIYVTLFNKPEDSKKNDEKIALITLIKEWGFNYHGTKESKNGIEEVYMRKFDKNLPINVENPKLTFPFFSKETQKFVICIDANYHTKLFPDSIHSKEDEKLYQYNEVYSNRIDKVYISYAPERSLRTGDIVLIYRTAEPELTPKIYHSIITSICIVESVVHDFKDFDDFYYHCVKKTMFTKDELKKDWWNENSYKKPFIVNLLYAFSLDTPKPNLNDLIRGGMFLNARNGPRSITKISDDQYEKFYQIIKKNYKRK